MNKKGFSLVELIIVVAIIATLAGIGIPAYRTSQKKARRAECISMLNICYKLQQLYYAQEDQYTQEFALLDVAGSNFPPVGAAATAALYYYDYGIAAEGAGLADPAGIIDYYNYIAANGSSTGSAQTVDYVGAAPNGNLKDAAAAAVGEFLCFAAGNVDGDATMDIMTVTQARGKATIFAAANDDVTN